MPDNSFPVGPVYTSPGFAVSNTIDDILTQKRLEARQAMLDQLNAQKVQSDIAYQHENALSLAQQRAAHAQEYQEQAFKDTIAPLGMNQNLSYMDPERLNTLIGRGVATPGVTPESGAVKNGLGVNAGSRMLAPNMDHPNVAFDPEASATGPESLTSPAPATKPPTFNGSPKEQDAAGQRERENVFIKSNVMGRTDLDPITKAALWQEYMNTPPPADLLKQMGPLGHLYVTDEGTGKTNVQPGINLSGGDHFVNIPRPPQGPAQQPFSYTDVNGDTQWTWQKPGVPFTLPNLHKGNPAAATKGNGQYDTGAYNKWLSVEGNQNIDDKDKAAAKSAAMNSIKDSSVRNDVIHIMGNDRYSDLTTDQLVQMGIIEAPQGATPEQAQHYIQTVKAILNDFGKQ